MAIKHIFLKIFLISSIFMQISLNAQAAQNFSHSPPEHSMGKPVQLVAFLDIEEMIEETEEEEEEDSSSQRISNDYLGYSTQKANGSPYLSREEQKAILEDEGLYGEIEYHDRQTKESLELLIERKKNELYRNEVLKRGPAYYKIFIFLSYFLPLLVVLVVAIAIIWVIRDLNKETNEPPKEVLRDPNSGIHYFLDALKNDSEPSTLEEKENEPLTHEPVINAEPAINAEAPKYVNSSTLSEEANNSLAERNNTIKNNTPIQVICAKENTCLNIDDALLEKAQVVAADIGLDLSSAVRMFLIQMVREKGLPFTPRASQIEGTCSNADTR